MPPDGRIATLFDKAAIRERAVHTGLASSQVSTSLMGVVVPASNDFQDGGQIAVSGCM